MIKIFYLCAFVILLFSQVHAEEIIFPDELISEIRVVETNKEEGRAVIVDGDGKQMEISVDDVISIDEVVVVEIETGHIIVKRGDVRSRMLVVPGF